MTRFIIRTLATAAAAATVSLALVPSTAAAAIPASWPQHAASQATDGTVQLARRGADDGPRHDARDDRGRGGRDGAKGRGRGTDDGPNHDANDDRGQRGRSGGKGRGRGSDDAPNHG